MRSYQFFSAFLRGSLRPKTDITHAFAALDHFSGYLLNLAFGFKRIVIAEDKALLNSLFKEWVRFNHAVTRISQRAPRYEKKYQ